MQKHLQANSSNRLLPVLFTLALMLASFMGFAQTAYITNWGDSTVSVINVATNTVIKTITVGVQPYGVSVSPDGSKVYITNSFASSVSVINAATNTVSATIPVSKGPEGISVSPDGSKVYVTNFDDGTVSEINAATNIVSATIEVGIEPNGLCVSPDGSKVYVANNFDGTVSVINTATDTVSATITVYSQPRGICISPNGNRIYVVDGGGVSVINTATDTILATATTAGLDPIGISISPDGSKIYVADYEENSVYVISTAYNGYLARIPVGSQNLGISVSPDGSKVYVANESSNTVSVMNAAADTVLDTIAVGKNPFAFGNFISTYTAPFCNANFSIAADSTWLHHYIVTDNSYGKHSLSYIWSWGDGTQDTIPYPSHTYADSGFYNICLSITDSTGCQSTFCDSSFHAMRTTNTMVYVNVVNPLLTGTKEVSWQTLEVVLYPNPATNQLTIHTSSFHNEAVMVLIMNVLGMETSPPAPLLQERGDAMIDVSKLSAGMYFLQLKWESGSVVKRFVKE